MDKLRFLSWIAVLLLFAPMYRQCKGGKVAEEKPEETITVGVGQNVQSADSLPLENPVDTVANETIVVEEIPVRERIYSILDPFSDDTADNANEMAWKGIDMNICFMSDGREAIREFKKEPEKSKRITICKFVRFNSFLFVVRLTWTFAIATQRRRFILARRILISNLVFLTVSLFSIPDPWFESWSQIKWGYYFFTILQLTLFYANRKRSRK